MAVSALLLLAMMVCALPCSAILSRPAIAPRGWNSYDSVGASNETVTLEMANILQKELLPLGYTFVVIDAGWYGGAEDAHIDEYGRLLPNLNNYPSADNGVGFKALADKIHSMGLKFGFWNTFGIPYHAVIKNTPIKGTTYSAGDIALDESTTCPWYKNLTLAINMSHPASQSYFDSVVELYDEWGIDLLKQDCSFGGDLTPSHWANVQGFSASLQASNRSYVYSMSPGGQVTPTMLDLIRPKATMARVTNDFWDQWENGWKEYPNSVIRHFHDVNQYANVSHTGFFFDLDMLPFGLIGRNQSGCGGVVGCLRRSKLTYSQQRAVMTLWSIAQSPLIYGGDLRANNQSDWDVITNSRVLDAQANARRAHCATNTSTHQVWLADSALLSQHYLAVFNLQATNLTTTIDVAALLPSCGGCGYVEAWTGKDHGTGGTVTVSLGAYEPALFEVYHP